MASSSVKVLTEEAKKFRRPIPSHSKQGEPSYVVFEDDFQDTDTEETTWREELVQPPDRPLDKQSQKDSWIGEFNPLG